MRSQGQVAELELEPEPDIVVKPELELVVIDEPELEVEIEAGSKTQPSRNRFGRAVSDSAGAEPILRSGLTYPLSFDRVGPESESTRPIPDMNRVDSAKSTLILA